MIEKDPTLNQQAVLQSKQQAPLSAQQALPAFMSSDLTPEGTKTTLSKLRALAARLVDRLRQSIRAAAYKKTLVFQLVQLAIFQHFLCYRNGDAFQVVSPYLPTEYAVFFPSGFILLFLLLLAYISKFQSFYSALAL